MKKHPLVRAIQYLEKHYGAVDTSASHDIVYLSVTPSPKMLSKHRLTRLGTLGIFIETDLDEIEEEYVEDIEYFLYFT